MQNKMNFDITCKYTMLVNQNSYCIEFLKKSYAADFIDFLHIGNSSVILITIRPFESLI